MFTKFKQAVEKWLRGLIAAEISNLDIELRLERAVLLSTIKVFDAQVKSLNEAVSHLNEWSYFQENAKQRETIKLLNEKAQALINSVKELHPALKKLHPELK